MGNEEEKILASRLPEKEPGLAKDKTLWSYTEARIAEIIAKFGDKDMWIDGATDEKISFQSFLTMVKKTAAVLKEKYGVGPGSVMLVCSKNDINFFIPVYAAVALGAVAFTVPDYSSNCIPTHLAEENVPVIVCDHSSLLEIEKYVDEAFEKSSDEDRVRSQIILMSGTHAGYLDVRNIATGNADKNIASAGISFSQYKPDMLLGAIQRYKVTTVWLYPKDAMYLTKLPEETWKEFDLSRVCRMSAGAAIFPASIVAVMRNIFPNLNRPISQTYGSTEMMLTVSSSTLMCSEQEAGLGVLAPRTKCKVRKTSDKNLLLTGGAEFIKSMVMSPGGKIYRMKLREDFIQQQKLRV
ncbi:unnamed protein product [Notodromas monacha]|uniref:AMP-dependent synthetase/ligase domain-containing protein n=1 Tax=Notodromas monacha TaxID=399045 RepID=A0A7R9BTC2_9CRUS|nr:unnamed protein product [Notodromas monacha]CAG0920316.1 unnamed protein product [Notodromas monacha]